MTMVSAERRLGNVVGVHSHLVVARAQIELGEEASPMKLVEKLIDDRNWEFVLGRLGVEGPVVDAKAPGVVCLAHQHHGGGERGRARPDDALGEHSSALTLQLILLQLGVAIGANGDRSCTRQQVDAVIIRSHRREPLWLGEDRLKLLQEPVQ